MHMNLHGRPSRPARGFALIEVLVSVVILAIAALGYAALQLRGLSTNSSAMWRSKATVLAYEAADRVRANVPGATAGQYNSLVNPAVVAACTLTNVCTSTQMAARDFAQWRGTVLNALPGGTGVICLDSTPDDGTAASPACDGSGTQIAIKVFWSERGTAARFVNVVRP
ncbi:MAG: type pilus modification protein PilV [Pseudomonadota bacterium]|jgi:type IV pilus assembly protein PilV